MPRSSSRSVRHDAVPRERVLAAAREWARQLRHGHPEIARIGCFGSYARGDYVPGSDLDVLIEVSDLGDLSAAARQRMGDRALRYLPTSFPVGVDLLVYTVRELSELRASGAGFIRTIDGEILRLIDSV